ncbi:MAG: hypothetical protein ACPGEG_08385 [Salibacteraceae bacterium]
MDKGLALNVLELDSSYDNEELEDAYENALFGIKSFLLQNVVIESLWIKKILRLSQIEEAYEVLFGEKRETPNSIKLVNLPLQLESYSEYESLFYRFKKDLSNYESCIGVVGVVKRMILLEKLYYNWFLDITGKMLLLPDSSPVKLNQKAKREVLCKLNNSTNRLSKIELSQISIEKARIEKLLTIK